MQAFTELTGVVLPLDRPNVDTDAIIPKQYLKSIRKTGFGDFLFDDWRYLDAGDLDIPVASRRKNPDFMLNQARYQHAKILLTRENFGCGSSREHAVWALDGYGIRCVIAPSFADIFYNNSFKSGLLPVILAADVIDQLFQACFAEDQYQLSIDLYQCEVKTSSNQVFKFTNIDAFRRDCLLNGLDDIGLTLQYQSEIQNYEAQRKISAPWLFN